MILFQAVKEEKDAMPEREMREQEAEAIMQGKGYGNPHAGMPVGDDGLPVGGFNPHDPEFMKAHGGGMPHGHPGAHGDPHGHAHAHGPPSGEAVVKRFPIPNAGVTGVPLARAPTEGGGASQFETGWGDCCGIPVPSAFAAAEAEKRGTRPGGAPLSGSGIRPVPFD